MVNKSHIKIGSRGSDLALWQAQHVKQQLENLGCEVSIEIIQTQGDKIQNLSFDKLEGKGFFTKELELALLEGSIDLAVHSHKDLETESPDGLEIVAVSERENPRELLLMHKNAVDQTQKFELMAKATIGTSAARRHSLIQAFRPDLNIQELRGNVPTRIEKLRAGLYDAIVLAAAGVERLKLDLSDLHALVLNPQEMVPAPAQGVLGLQIRTGDAPTRFWVHQLNKPEVEAQIHIERSVLNQMQGGCQLPLGVYNDGHKVFVAYAKTKQEPAQLFEFPLQGAAETIEDIVRTLKAL